MRALISWCFSRSLNIIGFIAVSNHIFQKRFFKIINLMHIVGLSQYLFVIVYHKH